MLHSQQSDKSSNACESLSLLNNTYLQQYKVSLKRSSNLSSNTIMKQVLRHNVDLLNEDTISRILGSANELLQNSQINNVRTWESSLSKFTDPAQLLEKLLAPCIKCQVSYKYTGIKAFQKNECKCIVGLTETGSSNSFNNSPFHKSIHSVHSSQEFNLEEDHKLFNGKFNKKNHEKSSSSKVDLVPNTSSDLIVKSSLNKEYDFEKEEEENRAHKSNVAKLTFKTAKEQLLASNPGAKRSLGASRKAQSKFVSPMLGAQDKQEVLEVKITDERLKHIDPKMIELIESEIIDKGTQIGWEDIAGLQLAKSVIQEAVVWPLLRPDIFTGLRRPPKGILLFGPPGTGKTLIGKCVAAQCKATFFSISASSLTSKWIGDGEKMVRALFAVARCHQPAVIFIDEIDSLLTQRSDAEHEATRRIKTEFLVQFDGAATGDDDRLLIVGATNRPQELDEAARRRLVKRLYIPLPDIDARAQIITRLLQTEQNELTAEHINDIANLTEGYSGADMKSLCSEAAMGPIRSVPLSQIVSIDRDKVRPVHLQDFTKALQRVRPSVSQDDLGQYVKWNNTYGQGF